MKRVLAWLEERTGVGQRLRATGRQALPGGASWARSLGVALLLVLVLEAVTGVLLAHHYSASTTDAWGSVWYIQHRLALGGLIRGLHYFGASAAVVLCVLHLVQAFLWGAYKAPRELNWISGLLLLGLMVGFVMTGALLPWDQGGYWQTSVEANIIGGSPVIGEHLRTLALGGERIGNLTLTRYYAMHSLVLPILLFVVLWGHLALKRRHGVVARPGTPEGAPTVLYWPTQVVIDLMLAAVAVAIVVALALLVDAPLDAPADPNSAYDARPEWYFLALYALRAMFEGPLELVATMLIPGLAGGYLLLVPFLDRKPDRRVASRRLWVGILVLGLLGAAALTALSVLGDRADERYQAARATQERNAREAAAYAGVEGWGIDARGRVPLYEGRKLFRSERCVECHPVDGESEEPKAPRLDGYLSRAWIRGLITDPNHVDYFGRTKLKYDEESGEGMPAMAKAPGRDDGLTPEALDALAEFLASLSGDTYDPPLDPARVAAGQEEFEGGECSGCHELEASESMGPMLKGYGGAEWLTGLLRNPTSPLYYGERGDGMPAFDHLSDDQLESLVGWLMVLKRDPT